MLGFALWLLGIVVGLGVAFSVTEPLWGERRRMLSWLALMVGALVLSAILPLAVHAQAIDPAVPRAAQAHRAELVRAARLHWGLNAPVAALAAQVQQESAWNPRAVSRVGAKGLTQFMPSTATWWCQINQLSPANCQPYNPTWALRAQSGYMKWLYDRVPAWAAEPGPAQPVDFAKLWAALRAYNGGLGHWNAEARATGLAAPTRQQVDAACGKARRSRVHCAENLGYPRRILGLIQPRYAAWGGVVAPAHGWAAL